MSLHQQTKFAAKGKWRGILRTFGVAEHVMNGRPQPCPLCGGTDRFVFDNRTGNGDYFCRNEGCGPGDGFKLAMGMSGKTFAEVAREIDTLLGNVPPDGPVAAAPVPVSIDAEQARRRMMNETWSKSVPMVPGDLADTYLRSRRVDEPSYPPSLRFAKAVTDGEGGIRPCMIAMVTHNGANVTMHRTFLRPDGKGKAEMASPRKLMPGPVPDGACVQLSDFTGGCLGIAEGIETALAASALFDVPVWSAINATMLAKWQPPEGCEEVAIFGDNDPKFAGQAAAYTLAHKLAVAGLTVTVHIPDQPGTDWNDVLLQRKGKPA